MVTALVDLMERSLGWAENALFERAKSVWPFNGAPVLAGGGVCDAVKVVSTNFSYCYVVVRSPRVRVRNPDQATRVAVDTDQPALEAGSNHRATLDGHKKFSAAVRGRGAVKIAALDAPMAGAVGAAVERSGYEHIIVDMAHQSF